MEPVEKVSGYETVKNQYAQAYVDYGMYSGEKDFAVLSFFERSEQSVRSIGASFTMGNGVIFRGVRYSEKQNYKVYYYQIRTGKSSIWHGIAVSLLVGKRYFISSTDDREGAFYDFLMENFNFPLMYEWKDEIYRALENRMVHRCENHGKIAVLCGGCDPQERYFESRGKRYSLADTACYEAGHNEGLLRETLSVVLREGYVHITEDVVQPLSVTTQDSYFKNYGASIVENLRNVVRPMSELNGNTDIVFNNKRMYPQQIAIVNAQAEYMRRNRAALIIGKMGTGKTLMGLGIVERYCIDRAFRRGEIGDIRDAYRDGKSLNYRVLIMCPGHLVGKWANEIILEVPFAKATVISSLSQLTELYSSGMERNGREYYIISKDTMKLTYQEIPTPRKMQRRRVSVKACPECGIPMRHGGCRICGGKAYVLERQGMKMYGLCCPYCGELLFRPDDRVDEIAAGTKQGRPLRAADFANKNSANTSCYYCGEKLWEPYVENTTPMFSDIPRRERHWYRSTYFKNKSRNGKITCWTMKGHEAELVMEYGEPVNEMKERTHGARKYSPSLFIERKMKKFFDIGIVDEVHTCKGGGSAQGTSFQHILNACDRSLNLTGTITGGTAADLFYLFWRLYPHMMVEMGYRWGDVERFCEDYGVVEKKYEYTGSNEALNVNSRGRQIGMPSIKPGISPGLFLKLIDKAAFLDITDFSSHLPRFYEKVVVTDIEETGSEKEREMLHFYRSAAKFLSEQGRSHNGIRGMKLQFELSYLDKPYGAREIIHPETGDCLLTPSDYSVLTADNSLLSKERDLVNIVKTELSSGRNCVVYAEFTGKEETNITGRLQEIVMRECSLKENEVIILKASSPTAAKREEWMHKKAEEGMKVLICNPACVATGLDFCWVNRQGKMFNYPTIIFYQMGTSLYNIAQASRRAWRLNQTEECRVYYMGVKGTKQQALIQLIAEKTSANGVMEGRFSVEGLAAMAEGIDVDVRLAQIMSEMDNTTVDELQGMFDVVNSSRDNDESVYGSYQKMRTYRELMGGESKSARTDIFDILSGFSSSDVFSAFQGFIANGDSRKDNENQEEMSAGSTDIPIPAAVVKRDAGKGRKTRRRSVAIPTKSLFDFV